MGKISADLKLISPWQRNHATVHLSKRRSAQLRKYADSIDSSMTPVEAVYSLIDQSDDKSAPPASGPQSEDILQRLDAMSRQSTVQANIIQDSNLALKAVAEILGPIHALLTSMAGSANDEEESNALDTANWISSVMLTTQSHGENQIAVRLLLRRTEIADEKMGFTFSAMPTQTGETEQTSIALPDLRVSGLPLQWQAVQTLSASSNLNLFLICSRENGGPWQGLVAAVNQDNERRRVLSFKF